MRNSAVLVACLVLTFPAAAADPPAGRTDAQGDTLPADAALRLGGTRLRHVGHVQGIAFSADGKRLASADYEGRVRVQEVENGRLSLELPAGTGTALAFAPD